jgi:hypothetical protein
MGNSSAAAINNAKAHTTFRYLLRVCFFIVVLSEFHSKPPTFLSAAIVSPPILSIRKYNFKNNVFGKRDADEVFAVSVCRCLVLGNYRWWKLLQLVALIKKNQV